MGITKTDTKQTFKVVESDDISKVEFVPGQYIIIDDTSIYYDPATKSKLSDRICLNEKNKIYLIENAEIDISDEYYLNNLSNVKESDICGICRNISGTNSYILYICTNVFENDTSWIPLSSKTNITDVYLDSDLKITIPIESIEMTNGVGLINSANKNLLSVMESILSPTKIPIIKEPTATVKLINNDKYEFGTTVTPEYLITFNPGEYEFDDSTGVVISKIVIEAYNNDTLIETKTLLRGLNKEFFNGTLKTFDVDLSTNYKLKVSVSYEAGTYPRIIPSNEPHSERIEANSIIVESNTINGYIEPMFFGTSEDDLSLDTSLITGEFIRSLNRLNILETNEIPIHVAKGTKTIILAFHNYIDNTTIINNTVSCNMTDAFKKINVNVPLINGSKIPYTVLYYSPVEEYKNDTIISILNR